MPRLAPRGTAAPQPSAAAAPWPLSMLTPAQDPFGDEALDATLAFLVRSSEQLALGALRQGVRVSEDDIQNFCRRARCGPSIFRALTLLPGEDAARIMRNCENRISDQQASVDAELASRAMQSLVARQVDWSFEKVDSADPALLWWRGVRTKGRG